MPRGGKHENTDKRKREESAKKGAATASIRMQHKTQYRLTIRSA
jgi:hypothetical protein